MSRIFPLIMLAFLVSACQDFDSTKIIAPTDFQIEAVSLNLNGDVLPTNVAAQKVEQNSQYTLVGATLKRQGKEIVGIWLFDENDPQAIKSINEIALTYSPFPKQNKLKVTSEARNLSAFLQR
ncbi:hypothetical protein WJR50_27125 [Catalinimonas sp. 4WD22]|jgi:hypothetical protein|uniref:hypothetical protein n=1 Tax=Catalinimonas locisalis TaxID=3133978 RepID=UPI0031017968